MHKIHLALLFFYVLVCSSEAFCGHGQSKGEDSSHENSSLNRSISQKTLPKRNDTPVKRSESATQLKRKGSSRAISIYSNLPKAIKNLYKDANDEKPDWSYIKETMIKIEERIKEIQEEKHSRYRDSMTDEDLFKIKNQLEFLREKVSLI